MRNPSRLFRAPTLAAMLLLGAEVAVTPVVAQADAASDAILAKTVEQRKATNSIQTMTMEVTSRKGRTQTRSLMVKTRVDGQSNYTLAEVVAPEDVAGTRFLARDTAEAAPELFLYLPRLNRTSKMLAKRAALLGSDFAPSEMDFSAWEDASHTYQGAETIDINGTPVKTEVIESTNSDPDADYPKAKLWLGADDGFPRRIEFMEADGTVVKRWNIIEVATADEINYPKRSVMETVAKGSKTTLLLENVRFKVPDAELPLEHFTEAALSTGQNDDSPTSEDGAESQ